jgi:transposase
MESTGGYWRPVYHILAETVEVVVGNPPEMRQRPGKKTDKAEARWIAEL